MENTRVTTTSIKQMKITVINIIWMKIDNYARFSSPNKDSRILSNGTQD